MTLALPLRLALRNLRGGVGRYGIFLGCIVLGVAAIVSVGSFSGAIRAGMLEDGQALLGGDVELSLAQRRLSAGEARFLAARGVVDEIATLRAMAESRNRHALVEIKAVDDDYPLFGQVAVDPGTLGEALRADASGDRIAVDPLLASRLSLAIGDWVNIGNAEFRLAALIRSEPDRVADGFILGPRVLMTKDALARTGLVKPGSLVTWRYRVALSSSAEPSAFIADLRSRFPDAGWRVRDRTNAAPGVSDYVERMSFFLTLAGLTSLVAGGLGVANAVKSLLDRRRRDIAVLRMLGASPGIGFAACLFEVLLVGLAGTVAGLLLGTLASLAAALSFGALLPLPLHVGLTPGPPAYGAAFAILTILGFSLAPLARARGVSAAELVRGVGGTAPGRIRARDSAAILASFTLLVGLVFLAFDDARATRWYVAGFAASLAILAGLGRGLVEAARRMPRPRDPLLGLAIANLHRPGAPTPTIAVSLGLGLTLFVMLSLLDRSLRHELEASLPASAPSFFFLDVDDASRSGFLDLVRSEPSVTSVSEAPMLRGRIVTVRGVPAERLTVAPDAQWALRGDRGLTYSDVLPQGSRLVEGDWWTAGYSGPPLVSFTEDIASALGLKRGDEVTVNVLGRDVTATVASLRSVDWRSLGMNFVMVFSPNALAGAPHSNLVSLRMDPAREDAFLDRVASAFPATTAIRIRDALAAVSEFLSEILLAVRASNALTLLTGILVVAGAWTASLGARSYETAVLKALGATRGQLLSLLAIEFAIVGLASAMLAVAAGTLVAWAVCEFYLKIDFAFSLPLVLTTVVLAMAGSLAAGLAATWRALEVRTSSLLRQEVPIP